MRPVKTGSGLCVRCLGTVSATFEGTGLALNALPKAVPLFAYLLMRRAEPVARERVAATFWPEATEAEARANLRRHVHSLGTMLPTPPPGTSWLLGTQRTIAIDPAAPVWFDVEEYARLAADPATLPEAVALYRGDFLTGYDDEWILDERRRLADAHVERLELLVADARRAREFSRATAYATEALRIDPYRETALRAMLAARYEAGDATGALAAYERFRILLASDVGADPMPETLALVARIARGDGLAAVSPALQGVESALSAVPGAAAAGGASSGPGALPFAGREREFDALRSAWAKRLAPSDRDAAGAAMTFVTGEAGVGKSRLVAEFAAEVERGGGCAFAGTTSSIEGPPYEAVVEALRAALALVARLDLDPVQFGVLAIVLPELAGTNKKLPIPAPLDDAAERRRLFDTIGATFEALARRRPTLVIFEDLQWASPATLALVDVLVRRASRLPLAFVATLRDGEPRDGSLGLRRALTKSNLAAEVALGPLDRTAVRDVAVRAGRVEAFDDARIDSLYLESEGNPFFLGFALASGGEAGPVVSRGAIAARLRAAGEDAHAFAEAAAIVGHAFDTEVVADVLGWPGIRAQAAVDELLDRRIVQRAARVAYAEFTFSHHLISRALYEDAMPRTREYAHRRAARALARLFPAHGGALALAIGTHYELAAHPADAAAAFLQAAERARMLSANEDALASAERAARLAADIRTRFRALSLAEELHAQRADRDAQRRTLAAMEAAAEELGAADAVAEVARRAAILANETAARDEEARAIAALEEAAAGAGARWIAEAALARHRRDMSAGRFESAVRESALAVETFEATDDPEGMLAALTAHAEALRFHGDPERARDVLARARDLAGRFASPRALARLLRAESSVAFIGRDLDRGLRTCEELLEICVRTGDREGEADIAARYATILLRRFDLARARQFFARARALYEQLGNVRMLAAIALNSNFVTFAGGDPAGAIEGFDEAGRRFEEIGDLRGRVLVLLNCGYALTHLRRFEEAMAALDAGLAIARDLSYPGLELQVQSNLATCHYRAGRPQRAYDVLAPAIEARRNVDTPIDLCEDLVTFARVCGDLGRIDEARAALRECEPSLERCAEQSHQAPELWYEVSLARAACGDSPGALAALERARATLDERAARFETGAERATFLAFGSHPHILASS